MKKTTAKQAQPHKVRFISIFLSLLIFGSCFSYGNSARADTEPVTVDSIQQPEAFSSNDALPFEFFYHSDIDNRSLIYIEHSVEAIESSIAVSVSIFKENEVAEEVSDSFLIDRNVEYTFIVKYDLDSYNKVYVGKFTVHTDVIIDETESPASFFDCYSSDSYTTSTGRYDEYHTNATAAGGNETEPNGTWQTANDLFGRTLSGDTVGKRYDINGYISSSSDIDWFKVSMQEGHGNFFIEGLANTDFKISVFEANGNATSIKSSANNGGVGAAETIQLLPVKTATYYIKVECVNSKFNSSQKYYFVARNYVAGTKDSNEGTSGNDSFATATTITSVYNNALNLHTPRDLDYFKFTLTSTTTVTLKVSGVSPDSNHTAHNQVNMTLYNSSQSTIGSWSNISSSSTATKSLIAGTYYVLIESTKKDLTNVNAFKLLYTFNYSISSSPTPTPTPSPSPTDDYTNNFPGQNIGNIDSQSPSFTQTGKIDYSGDVDCFRFYHRGDSYPVYEITFTGPTGTTLRVYDESESEISSSGSSRYQCRSSYTMIKIASNTVGNYTINIKVIDNDANVSTLATVMSVNSSTATATASGKIDYNNDQDWFVFAAPITGQYTVYTNNSKVTQKMYLSTNLNSNLLPTDNFSTIISVAAGSKYYICIGDSGSSTGQSYKVSVEWNGDFGNSRSEATPTFENKNINGQTTLNDGDDYFYFVPTQTGTYQFFGTGNIQFFTLYNSTTASTGLVQCEASTVTGSNHFYAVYALTKDIVYYVRATAKTLISSTYSFRIETPKTKAVVVVPGSYGFTP